MGRVAGNENVEKQCTAPSLQEPVLPSPDGGGSSAGASKPTGSTEPVTIQGLKPDETIQNHPPQHKPHSPQHKLDSLRNKTLVVSYVECVCCSSRCVQFFVISHQCGNLSVYTTVVGQSSLRV